MRFNNIHYFENITLNNENLIKYITEKEFIGECYIDKCKVNKKTKSHIHKLCNHCLMFLEEKTFEQNK